MTNRTANVALRSRLLKGPELNTGVLSLTLAVSAAFLAIENYLAASMFFFQGIGYLSLMNFPDVILSYSFKAKLAQICTVLKISHEWENSPISTNLTLIKGGWQRAYGVLGSLSSLQVVQTRKGFKIQQFDTNSADDRLKVAILLSTLIEAVSNPKRFKLHPDHVEIEFMGEFSHSDVIESANELLRVIYKTDELTKENSGFNPYFTFKKMGEFSHNSSLNSSVEKVDQQYSAANSMNQTIRSKLVESLKTGQLIKLTVSSENIALFSQQWGESLYVLVEHASAESVLSDLRIDPRSLKYTSVDDFLKVWGPLVD